MKRARPTAVNAVEVPEGVCLQCFNEQQRFGFPFLVYCVHSEQLALVRSPQDNATFPCKPRQLRSVLAKLSEGGGVHALPPAGHRL
jgi:hypothetical protein